jgi:hypothetical protein
MPANIEIAEALLSACLSADHKPGKIQFTKYLYVLDYCHWRFTGRKATTLPWRFYHYGPWCEEVETCMATLANRYSFGWREEEAAIVQSVDVPMPSLDLTTKSTIVRIVDTFKNRDLNVLLDFAYSQTEPMATAKRGDVLNFSGIPVDRSMPEFFPKAATTSASYEVHPERKRRMEAFNIRAEVLRQKARERMGFRDSDAYHQALGLVAEELASYAKMPEIQGEMTLEAADGLGAD